MRGEQAHRTCEQFLVCVCGSYVAIVDDGLNRNDFVLDRPTLGVYVPPMVWAMEHQHSQDSTLMVFASEHYDPKEHIIDYEDLLSLVVSDDLKPQA